MATLDKGQIAKLKRLMQEDGWDILRDWALPSHIVKLESEPVTGTNAFETLRALHTRQGKVDGLKEFFDDVEKLNFN